MMAATPYGYVSCTNTAKPSVIAVLAGDLAVRHTNDVDALKTEFLTCYLDSRRSNQQGGGQLCMQRVRAWRRDRAVGSSNTGSGDAFISRFWIVGLAATTMTVTVISDNDEGQVHQTCARTRLNEAIRIRPRGLRRVGRQ